MDRLQQTKKKKVHRKKTWILKNLFPLCVYVYTYMHAFVMKG